MTAGSIYVSLAGFFGFAVVVFLALAFVAAGLADFGAAAFLVFTSANFTDCVLGFFLGVGANVIGASATFASSAADFLAAFATGFLSVATGA